MYDSNGNIPPVKVEILTIEVSITRRAFIIIKVTKSIRGLFTNNPEPEIAFTLGFVLFLNLIFLF
jgi:hypothetical protein